MTAGKGTLWVRGAQQGTPVFTLCTKTPQSCSTRDSSSAMSHFPHLRKWMYHPSCTIVSSHNTNLLLKTFCSNRVLPGHCAQGGLRGWGGSLAFTCQWLLRAPMCPAVPPGPPPLLKPLTKFSNPGNCGRPYNSFQLDLTGNLYSHQPQYLQSIDNFGLVARK